MSLQSVSQYWTVAGPEIISEYYISTYHNIVLTDYHIKLPRYLHDSPKNIAYLNTLRLVLYFNIIVPPIIIDYNRSTIFSFVSNDFRN